ncbi:MAG: DUF4349 domain-containing protein [Tissierellia bacterium]|nr:DUF4349 domain-containing protein [Tissierellia bacterium]
MRRFRKCLTLFLILLLSISILIGCGSKQDISNEGTVGLNSTMDSAMSEREEVPAHDVEASEEAKDDNSLEPDKVITTIEIYFETTQFEKSNKNLIQLLEEHDAYIEDSNISHNPHHGSQGYRDAFYSIRVPKNNIQAFKANLDQVGSITNENTSKSDVTKQYRDTESRLKVIEVKEERILSLLSKAEKIEDIIKLEEQLSNTIYEKEELKASLMDMDDRVDYSTVLINIWEVKKVSSLDTADTKFGARFLDAVGDSIFFFKRTLENLILLSVYVFPFALVVGIIIFLAVKIIRRIRGTKE